MNMMNDVKHKIALRKSVRVGALFAISRVSVYSLHSILFLLNALPCSDTSVSAKRCPYCLK